MHRLRAHRIGVAAAHVRRPTAAAPSRLQWSATNCRTITTLHAPPPPVHSDPGALPHSLTDGARAARPSESASSLDAQPSAAAGANRAAAPQPEIYEPANFAHETAARKAAAAAAAAAAGAPSDASAAPGASADSGASSGQSSAAAAAAARAQFLSDMSRVFLGASLVLQQQALMANNYVADTVSTLKQQNEKNVPTVQDAARVVQETMRGGAAQAQAAAAAATAPSILAQGEQAAKGIAQQVETVTRGINAAAGSPIPATVIDTFVAVQKQAGEQVARAVQQFGAASQQAAHGFAATSTSTSGADKYASDAMYGRMHVNKSAPAQEYESAASLFGGNGAQSSATSAAPLPPVPQSGNGAAAANRLVSDAVHGAQKAVNQAAEDVNGMVNSAAEVASAATAAAATAATAAATSAAATAATAAVSVATNTGTHTFNTFSDFKPRERTVPSSPLARIAGFSQIASSIILGTIKDRVTGVFAGDAQATALPSRSVDTRSATERANGGASSPLVNRATATMSSGAASATPAASASSSSSRPNPVVNSFLSEANTERLAEGLCRMRGAALKVGQMLSIQDESLVPPQLQAVLDRVRDGADVMPRKQLERALSSELGSDWESRVASFEWQPLAAASIGQVHAARLLDGREVVMKVQYPGVAESINSDVNNLKRLIRFVNVLPRGMYIDETMRAAKEELALECDYSNEALAQKKFRKLVSDDKAFYVPAVIDDLSTHRILTTERIYGVPIDRLSSVAQPVGSDKIFVADATRNDLCRSLLRLVLHELFIYRFMQTDPNWSNFLFNPNTKLIYLIDFGASRLYKKQFVDEYLRMVHACSVRDRQRVIDSSIKLGFLTGDESKEMMDAHVQAGFIIGEPFGSDEPYDFVKGNIAARVSELASVMLRDRLTAPPKEAYTLHRKLSGAFLTCRKLEATVECKTAFLRLYNSYQFGPELPLEYGSASKDSVDSRLTPDSI